MPRVIKAILIFKSNINFRKFLKKDSFKYQEPKENNSARKAKSQRFILSFSLFNCHLTTLVLNILVLKMGKMITYVPKGKSMEQVISDQF